MKKCVVLIVVLSMFVLAGLQAGQSSCKGSPVVNRLLDRFADLSKVKVVGSKTSDEGWSWIEFDWYDEQYPLTIDVLISTTLSNIPRKIMYLVAPSGLNFRSTYFAPSSRNLAQFIRQEGYCVIGITFREDHVPPAGTGAFMADWGLAKHVADMAKVIGIVERFLPSRYDMLGQASAAVCILDYASKHRGRLDKIILLDTDSFDPAIRPEKVQYARMTFEAYNTLLAEGTFADRFTADFKNLVAAGTLYPAVDSGVSREMLGLPGDFTFAGLLNFSLIFTASLPGIHTPITGLPGEWPMMKGIASGYYNFALSPALDDFGLNQTRLASISEALSSVGEGNAPLAINRDIYGILSLNNPQYTINFKKIDERVIMVNGQYSSGEQTYYGTLLRQAGNKHVNISVIPDYAYLDLLYADNAYRDVWPLFLK